MCAHMRVRGHVCMRCMCVCMCVHVYMCVCMCVHECVCRKQRLCLEALR